MKLRAHWRKMSDAAEREGGRLGSQGRMGEHITGKQALGGRTDPLHQRSGEGRAGGQGAGEQPRCRWDAARVPTCDLPSW